MASMNSNDVWENCFGDENTSDMYVPEIDDTILKQLSDECGSEEADDGHRMDQSVIRSLEDEIGGPARSCGGGGGMMAEAIHPYGYEACEDCGLDEILSGLQDGHDCGSKSSSSAFVVEDPYFRWMEMEAAEGRSPRGSNGGEWYVDECMHGIGGVVCGDESCYSSFYNCGDAASMEQVCGSLWE